MSDDEKKKPRAQDYQVGYGKPPIGGRFVKGKSGNPRGRPRKSAPKTSPDTTVRDRVLREADRLVSIREGENVLQVPLSEAVQRAEAFAALKGNTHAQRNFLEREARYRTERSAEIEEENRFWRDYAERYPELIAYYKATGPSSDELPHPDDLVFEEGQPVMFRGGDPIEAKRHRELRIRLRDVFLLQAERDLRHHCGVTGAQWQDAPAFISTYFVVTLNDSLPKRLRLDDIQLFMRMMLIHSMKTRDLAKQLRKGWAELGIPEAKDLITAPIEPLLEKLRIEYRKQSGNRQRYRASNAREPQSLQIEEPH